MVLKGNVSYNDVLPLINSIIQRNKYANIMRNETNSTFIWRSEKGANTCADCKSLDNAIFYPGDIMIVAQAENTFIFLLSLVFFIPVIIVYALYLLANKILRFFGCLMQ